MKKSANEGGEANREVVSEEEVERAVSHHESNRQKSPVELVVSKVTSSKEEDRTNPLDVKSELTLKSVAKSKNATFNSAQIT